MSDVCEDNDLADFSSFRIPNKLLRKIGELARYGYDHESLLAKAFDKPDDAPDTLTRDEWTLIEEVITGFENR